MNKIIHQLFATMKKTLLFALFIGLQSTTLLFAQDSLPVQRIIEDVIEQIGDENEFDFNTEFEHLESYLKKPLNLNRASVEALSELGLLTPAQVNALVTYRTTVGELIALEELQAIPLFDLATIQRIQPFVKVSGDADDFQVSFRALLRGGKHTVFVRSRRILETQKGYIPDENTGLSEFTGSPYQVYSRYKYTFDNRFSYGLTMEKDMGEAFGGVYNPRGFDFYSAHFYLHDYNKRLKDVAIGDFQLNFGQGLLMWSGFGFGKSSFVTSAKRLGRKVKSYTSVSEFAFLRGGAATLGLTDKINVTAFASYKNRDANITVLDTVDADILEVSSLQISGLHRTLNEILDEGAIQEFTTGGSLQYAFNAQSQVNFNVVYTQLSAPLRRSEELYNLFQFEERRLLNASLDYSYVYKNLNFFGEAAKSQNGGMATTNGLLISLDRMIDVAILQRYFQPNFYSLYNNAFAETSSANNEKGVYIGLQIKPSRKWEYSFYFDTWQHPWLRFQLDAPGKGHEYFGQVTYQPSRGTQVYFRLRNEVKSHNYRDDAAKMNYLVEHRKVDARLHFQHKITKTLEWRSRLAMAFYNDAQTWTQGVVVFQDLIFRPMDLPFSFSTRLALFDTDNYDTRIYAFENDVLYSFSVPPFYNQGSRFYFTMRYNPMRQLTLEARLAQTRWTNQETIGSGLNEIAGQRQTEVKIQLRWVF